MKTSRFLVIAWGIGLGLAGCATRPKEVVPVEVISSKPYDYITWSPHDEPETQRQIRRHNRAHQAVIDAEKKAKP